MASHPPILVLKADDVVFVEEAEGDFQHAIGFVLADKPVFCANWDEDRLQRFWADDLPVNLNASAFI
jgi:hypothetical protein